MTRQQIRLYFHWSQRDRAREHRTFKNAVEVAVGRAITRSVFGKDPDTGQ